MTREEFSELRARFEELLQEAPSRREALLADLAQSTPERAEELRRMLEAHASSTGLIDRPAVDTILRSPIAAGAQLGAYRLVKELGRGGMGVVFEGTRAPMAASTSEWRSKSCGMTASTISSFAGSNMSAASSRSSIIRILHPSSMQARRPLATRTS